MYRSLIAAMCLAALTVGAADLKIATLDMKKVFDEYYKTRQFEQVIAQDADMLYLEKLEKEHAELRDKLQQLINRTKNIVMTEEAKKENQQEGMRVASLMREKEQDITRTKRKLERRKADERDVIVKEINGVISAYAKEQGFDLLLDSSGETMNGIPTLVFAREDLAVTETVIARLNAGHEKELEELNKNAKPSEAKPTLNPVDAPEDEVRNAVDETVKEK